MRTTKFWKAISTTPSSFREGIFFNRPEILSFFFRTFLPVTGGACVNFVLRGIILRIFLMPDGKPRPFLKGPPAESEGESEKKYGCEVEWPRAQGLKIFSRSPPDGARWYRQERNSEILGLLKPCARIYRYTYIRTLRSLIVNLGFSLTRPNVSSTQGNSRSVCTCCTVEKCRGCCPCGNSVSVERSLINFACYSESVFNENRFQVTRRVHTVRETNFNGTLKVDSWYLKIKCLLFH